MDHRAAEDRLHAAGADTVALLREVQAVARRRPCEVDHLARTYRDGRAPMEPVDARRRAS